jgi:hypothetical protein
MKRTLALLHGLPLVIYLVIGFFAWTKYTEWRAVHRAQEERFLASTIMAFKEINEENERLQKQLIVAKRNSMAKVKAADEEKAKQNEILTAHPVATAPASCAPWTQALLSCQREAQDLRAANLILNSALDSAKAVSERVDTTLKSGTKALEKSRCKFPCLDLELVAGPGGVVTVQDGAVKVYPGVFAGLKVLRVKLF